MSDSALRRPDRTPEEDGAQHAGWLAPAPWHSGELRERIAAGDFGSPMVRAWREQIERIRTDLIEIQASRGLIEDLRQIVARNPRLQGWNFLLDQIFRWYATSTLVLVYRDVDRSKNTVGLLRLLDKIRRNANHLTRAAFRKLHSGRAEFMTQPAGNDGLGEWIELRIIEKAYDRLSGGGESLDVGIIADEIARLTKAAEEVEELRHKVYAHRAAVGPAIDSINLGTIHRLIDVAAELVQKYISVLLYESLIDTKPVDLTDWQEILTFPGSHRRGTRRRRPERRPLQS